MEFKTLDIELKNSEGKVLNKIEGTFPKDWSENACRIFATQYFKNINGRQEVSVNEVFERVVNALHSNQDKNEKLFNILLKQEACFNSPVLYNLGSEANPQTSACFIQSIDDSIDGIYDLLTKEGKLFKYGSGTGTNFSSLRPKDSPVKGGGLASGVLSYLHVFDSGAGATKSGGKHRRAAKMVILNYNHPEILEFINWKTKEEKKAKILIENGYNSHFNGEAYKTVSGQNSNTSVRLNKEFWEALKEDKDIILSHEKSDKQSTIKASVLLDEIAKNAWETGDPGLQFDDTINKWNTVKERINASNPCSEYMFIDDSACNLASINLIKYFDNFEINTQKFIENIELLIESQDKLIDISSFPSEKIRQNSVYYRPLGLGYCNLGGLIFSLNLPYESEDAQLLCSLITAFMHFVAMKKSNDLYKETKDKSKLAYQSNKKTCDNVTRKFIENFKNLNVTNRTTNDNIFKIYDIVRIYLEENILKKSLDKSLVNFSYPLKNMQLTCIAPTGTIGLIMDSATGGIEPEFSFVKYKTMADGSIMKFTNPLVDSYLDTYLSDKKEYVKEYLLENNTLIGSNLEGQTICVFKNANEIEPQYHIAMMASAQRFLSGAISKTVNLPESATIEDIKSCYINAYKCGLKSIALYRNNCKSTQPLSGTLKKEIVPRNKLGNKRKGITIKFNIGELECYLRTGEFEDGTIGEFFIDIKKARQSYRTLMSNFAESCSILLQFGTSLKDLAARFIKTKSNPRGVVTGHEHVKICTSIQDAIFNILLCEYENNFDFAQSKPVDYIVKNDIKIKHDNCPKCLNCNCKTERNGSCFICKNCGQTTGCS